MIAGWFPIDTEVTMARYKFRRAPRFDNLESRELLSTVPASQAPSDEAQYMLQLLNMARTDPQAAVSYLEANITPDIQATLNYYGVNLQATLNTIGSATAQPPLAWNADLAQAAQGHSQDMANNNFQSHNGSDGSNPTQRMESAGYSNPTSTGENVYAYGSSVDQAMEAFLLDWGVSDAGHRDNILQPNVSAQDTYRDVGIGLVTTNGSNSTGPLVVTQDFGAQANEQAQVVGAVYNDPNGTGSYQVGEGVGNVQITAVNVANGQVSSTQTWASGGYELALSPGNYQLIASQNNQVIGSRTITINNVNIEQDFNLTANSPVGASLSAAISAAQPQSSAPAMTVQVASQAAQPQSSAPAVTVQMTPQAAPAQAAPAPVAAINWNWTNWSAKN
jgi:uncharacterized protein YkwD